LCAVYDWTRQGTDGFLGHDRCQGQTFGSPARRQGALILMGGWCGAHTADTARKKTGMRLRLPVGASVPGGTPRKIVVKSGVRESIPTATFNSLLNVLVLKGVVTTRSGSLKGLSNDRRTHDLRLLRGWNFWRCNLGPENYFLLQKSLNKSTVLPQSVIRPLVAALDALDRPGDYASGPTRRTPARLQSYRSAGVRRPPITSAAATP
jgi:hypothetical protein